MKKLNEFDYFKAWLLFFLIATVAGGMLGMMIATPLAAFLSAQEVPLRVLGIILQIVGLIIAMPLSYFTFRIVVGKYLFPKIQDGNNLPAGI